MSQITIQCRLVANESTRHQLWKLMADLNTPLINELLQQVSQHQDFETWRQKGKIPEHKVKELCQPLRTDPRFIGQPGRFYTSAIATVHYIYKAWLAMQKRLQQQLDGQTRWLEMLKSDAELVEISGYSLNELRAKASEILAQVSLQSNLATFPELNSKKSNNKKQQSQHQKESKSNFNVANALFGLYKETEDILSRYSISYLIKNGCQVKTKEESHEKFAKRRRKVEIRVQRLTEQLSSRIPKGRNLTDAEWLETLAIAATTVPKDEAQAKSWQDNLLKETSALPFPVVFESNEDMKFFKNPKGRICVQLSGLREHCFEVYCDQRQLHWFQRFLEDQQTKRNSKNEHSSSLFTLRSGRVSWQEGNGKGHPWNIHRLTFYCTVDTRMWTAEGTEQVKKEKSAEIARIISQAKDKKELNKNQEAFIKRQNSVLSRINNQFPRPSQPIYQGQSHILVGVSLGLEKPATVAVMDAIANKVIAYRSIRQLLGKNYRLLNRQRQQKHNNAHKRKIDQSQNSAHQYCESDLGQYIDRLLAKAIVDVAKNYQAGSIVLPAIEDIRESIQSEIQAKAEHKCPDLVEAQKKYAKQYRSSIHSWSYGRLIESIQSQAGQIGIIIEKGRQPVQGNPQEKAKELAIAAYKSRLNNHK